MKDITIGCTAVGYTISGDRIMGEVVGFGRKGGRPLVDIVEKNGDKRWLYIEQIINVIYD